MSHGSGVMMHHSYPPVCSKAFELNETGVTKSTGSVLLYIFMYFCRISLLDFWKKGGWLLQSGDQRNGPH